MSALSASSFVERLFRLYDGLDSIEVREDTGRAAVMAHGWYMRVRRSAEAIRVLDDVGYSHEAAPLRRSMIEHALALHWLADATEAAVDALLVSHQERMRRIRESMTDDWPVDRGLFDPILNSSIPSSPEMTYLAFKHLCDRYDQSDLFVAWLLETSHSHPSFSSAVAYTEGESIEELVLTDGSADFPSSDDEVVALMMLIASQGFNRLIVGSPWTTVLAAIEGEMTQALSPAPVER